MISFNLCDLQISRLSNGLTVASLDMGGPISHLIIAYRAGTRYEEPQEAGIVHHIRNLIGSDSPQYYGAQLLWQCGTAGAALVSQIICRHCFQIIG